MLLNQCDTVVFGSCVMPFSLDTISNLRYVLNATTPLDDIAKILCSKTLVRAMPDDSQHAMYLGYNFYIAMNEFIDFVDTNAIPLATEILPDTSLVVISSFAKETK
jgi:hypothetical protein